MPECQAFGCVNKQGKGKGFFMVPNARKFPEKRELAMKWLHYIGTGHTVDKFSFGKHKVVCEDHFESWCFETESKKMAALLCQKVGKKTIVPAAYPTLFVHRRPNNDEERENRAKKRQSKKEVMDVLSGSTVMLSTNTRRTALYDDQAVDCKKSKKTAVTMKKDETMELLSIPESIANQSTAANDVQVSMCQNTGIGTIEVGPVLVDSAVQTDSGSPTMCDRCKTPIGAVNMINAMHSYCKPRNLLAGPIESVSHIEAPDNLNLPVCSVVSSPSRPIKRKYKRLQDQSSEAELIQEQFSADDHYVDINDLAYSDISCNRESDVDYMPSEGSSDSDSDSDSNMCYVEEVVSEKKFVVFESCLQNLFYKIPCGECGSAVEEINKTCVGSMLKVKLFCIMGHLVHTWDSQPY